MSRRRDSTSYNPKYTELNSVEGRRKTSMTLTPTVRANSVIFMQRTVPDSGPRAAVRRGLQPADLNLRSTPLPFRVEYHLTFTLQ